MRHAIAIATVWIAGNVFLWSLKQPPLILFWQTLGMAAVAFPAMHWYVTRPAGRK